jgi:hypothetical protein
LPSLHCSQATRSAQALSAAQDEGRQLETQCAELRSQLDRALRDKRSGEAEMEQLKAKAVHFIPGKLEDVSKQAAQVGPNLRSPSIGSLLDLE